MLAEQLKRMRPVVFPEREQQRVVGSEELGIRKRSRIKILLLLAITASMLAGSVAAMKRPHRAGGPPLALVQGPVPLTEPVAKSAPIAPDVLPVVSASAAPAPAAPVDPPTLLHGTPSLPVPVAVVPPSSSSPAASVPAPKAPAGATPRTAARPAPESPASARSPAAARAGGRKETRAPAVGTAKAEPRDEGISQESIIVLR